MFIFSIIFIYIIGFIIIAVAHGNGTLHYFYFDVLGGIVMGIPIMLTAWRLFRGRCNPYFNLEKKNQPLYEFIYRIGAKIPVYGQRIPGMGFSKIKGLGIVQELGKASSYSGVYGHGDKSVQFVLQDVAHTPDPKFAGFCSWLTSIGFNNLSEVNDVFNGLDADTMAKIWHNIKDDKQVSPESRVVDKLQNMSKGEKRVLNHVWNKETKRDSMYKVIDKLKKKDR